MPDPRQLLILAQTPAPQEKRIAALPKQLCRLIQAVAFHCLSSLTPARLAAIADITPFVVPPKLKAPKRPIPMVFDAYDEVAVKQQLYLRFVFYVDFSHLQILPEKSPAL